MIGAGNISDKFLPHLTKAQKGYTALPQAQWGQLVNPTTIAGLATLAVKAKELFGFNEPKIIRTPASAPKRLSIRDPRKIMMTTGKPLRPNSDLVSGEYDSEQLGNLLTEAKRRNMSYNDMMNLAAMGFQETKWGKSDDNIGHTKGDFGPEQDSYSSFINAYNTKMKDADRLKIKDEATRLQVYNGLGKIFPSTEADYHGFKMKKIYGVEVPKGGIDLRKNPLYGKQVIDIRDNVLKRNPEFMRYMDSTYRAPMPEEEFNNGGLVKMQKAGQYTAQRDAVAVNTAAQSKMFGAQREIDVNRFSEDAFKQRYNMTPHQYKMRTDSNYAQAFERQMDQRRQYDPNYGEINLPETDRRSQLYRGNPNLALIPKGATGPARAQQEQLFTEMTSMAAPILPLKSLPGMLAARRSAAAPRILGQLDAPPSSISITPTGSVSGWGDLNVSSPNWNYNPSSPAWETARGVRDWPISNFNSGLYNRTNSFLSNTAAAIDRKLGEMVSRGRKAPEFNPEEITKLINKNLSKGVGVKKEALPLQVRYYPVAGSDDSTFALETLIDNNKTGSIFFQRNMDAYRPKTLSEFLLNKKPSTSVGAWENTPGFRKRSDFPFQDYNEFNPVKDPSGKIFNKANDLYNTGISGEFNKAINEAFKKKGLGNILSGGTGHSRMGEARWRNLVNKGLAEDLGEGNFILKKQGGPILDPRGQWAHPGKVTRIPGSDITMQGVPYPVYGVGSNGQEQMMYPDQEYDFGGASYVDEYPMMGKGGEMIRRADGSYSKRGLWDNIRAAAGSGKKPTKEMLKQEKKIKANMQFGGLWDTDKVAYLDSTVNANRNLEFIQRAMKNNGMNIPTPKGAPGYGKGKTSSHLMTYDPKSARSYPELVNMNGTLKYLTGDAAYNYAEDTGEYIQFPNAQQADYFSQNYKKSNYIKVGKQPLEKKHSINVTYKK